MNTKHLDTLKTLLLAGATAALVTACGGPELGEDVPVDEMAGSAILGSDACKNTDIQITNSYVVSGSSRRIKVLKVEYYSASEGRWYDENLADTEIPINSSRWWFNQDLQYAENDLLTQFKIHFKYEEFDGDWSDTIVRTDNILDVTCRAGQNFYLTAE